MQLSTSWDTNFKLNKCYLQVAFQYFPWYQLYHSTLWCRLGEIRYRFLQLFWPKISPSILGIPLKYCSLNNWQLLPGKHFKQPLISDQVHMETSKDLLIYLLHSHWSAVRGFLNQWRGWIKAPQESLLPTFFYENSKISRPEGGTRSKNLKHLANVTPFHFFCLLKWLMFFIL